MSCVLVYHIGGRTKLVVLKVSVGELGGVIGQNKVIVIMVMLLLKLVIANTLFPFLDSEAVELVELGTS